jgi:hypothetical protein
MNHCRLRELQLLSESENRYQTVSQMNLYIQATPKYPDIRTAQDEITRWKLQQELEGKR